MSDQNVHLLELKYQAMSVLTNYIRQVTIKRVLKC